MTSSPNRNAIPSLQPGTRHGGGIGSPTELEDRWLKVVDAVLRRLGERGEGGQASPYRAQAEA